MALLVAASSISSFASNSFDRENPQYWFGILGERDSFEPTYHRNPSSELLHQCWDKITAMPAKTAWLIFAQIQRPDSADLYPVDKVLEWAYKNVSVDFILSLMGENPDYVENRILNDWLIRRWGYFYIKKYGAANERIYLQKLINKENPKSTI
jgi:hypothetical protein